MIVYPSSMLFNKYIIIYMHICNMLVKKNPILLRSKFHVSKAIATAVITHLKPMFLWYTNQSIYLYWKSIDWCLYEAGPSSKGLKQTKKELKITFKICV